MLNAFVEPLSAAAKTDDKFQFERHGYFVADRMKQAPGKVVFNLDVGLMIVGGNDAQHSF